MLVRWKLRISFERRKHCIMRNLFTTCVTSLRDSTYCVCVCGVFFFCRCLPPHFTILVGSANSFVALLYARLSFELSVRTGNILLSGQHPWTKQLGRTSCFLFDFRFRPHHRPLFQFFFPTNTFFVRGDHVVPASKNFRKKKKKSKIK